MKSMRYHPSRRRSMIGFASLATVATVVLTGCQRPGAEGAETPEEFFEGETIELVVPFAPDGGTDVTARLIARLLSDFIPGTPSIQVVNIEGGNSVIGSNEFARDGGDGLHMLMTSTTTSNAVIFGDPAVQFEWSDFAPVAAVPSGAVQYVNTAATGIAEPEGIFEFDDLIYGGVTPGGGELLRLLGLDILSLEVEEVFGYDSRSAIQIAFQQGEVNFDGQTSQTYMSNIQPLVDDGEALPVYTQGFLVDGEVDSDPAFPDIASLPELYEERNGEVPSGEAWDAYTFMVATSINLAKPVWMHGEAPSVATEAVEQAFADMVESPEFTDTIAKEIGYDLLLGEDLIQSAASLTDPPQATVDWLVQFARDNYDADLSVG